MLVGVLNETNFQDCAVDIVELRIDLMDNFEICKLSQMLKNIQYPVIVTVRSKIDGGNYFGSEAQRLQLLLEIAKLDPEYIDLEHHVSVKFISLIKKNHPNIKIIRSYHNFDNTPANISELFGSLIHEDVFCYKIVTKANCFLDNIKIIDLLKKNSSSYNLSAHCLGENSLFSRVLGKIFGSFFTYAQINQSHHVIADCPNLKVLNSIYNISKIDKNTMIYALVGDPVDHSVGHIFHNKIFNKNCLNLAYLKIKLGEYEVPNFMDNIQGLPVKGLSVTTPLKHIFARYLGVSDYAINTIKFSDHCILTTNTDSKGAIDALLDVTRIESKVVFILGAGSVARMIVGELLKYTKSIIVINRSKTDINCYRTYDFKTILNCQLKPDIIINSIPSQNNKLVYDILQPFLSESVIYLGVDYAKACFNIEEPISDFGARVISPITFYEKQAFRQLKFWGIVN